MNIRSLYLDIHILQTIPPNNMNRDDTGSPKTARFGGVTRQRVSSQAWKKAIRDEFEDLFDSDRIGIRTKRVIDLVSRKVQEKDSNLTLEQIEPVAEKVIKALKKPGKKGELKIEKDKDTGELLTSYLFFVNRGEADRLAEYVYAVINDEEKINRGKIIEAMNKGKRAVDIALFGRMLADAPDLNVDAAVQVAHAIGVGRMADEFDYFTALDDRQPDDESGAAMIGTTEFASSTLYRYACVDVRHLYDNLGSVAAAKNAVKAFFKAFTVSMPKGKQNSFANRTLPSAVVVQLRKTQPVSLVNAFEVPVEGRDGRGTVELACEKMVEQEKCLDEAFGTAPEKTYVIEAEPSAVALEAMRSDDTREITSMKDVAAHLGEDVELYLETLEED